MANGVPNSKPPPSPSPLRNSKFCQAKLRILVTGGAGFIGSHLVDKLMEDDKNEVIVADNFFTGSKDNLRKWIGHPNFELIRHDVTEPLLVEVDQIYHLACPASPIFYKYNPVKTIKTNVIGTLNMLGLAKRVGARILLTSTSEVYGDPLEHPQKEEYWGNVNPIGEGNSFESYVPEACGESLKGNSGTHGTPGTCGEGVMEPPFQDKCQEGKGDVLEDHINQMIVESSKDFPTELDGCTIELFNEGACIGSQPYNVEGTKTKEPMHVEKQVAEVDPEIHKPEVDVERRAEASQSQSSSSVGPRFRPSPAGSAATSMTRGLHMRMTDSMMFAGRLSINALRAYLNGKMKVDGIIPPSIKNHILEVRDKLVMFHIPTDPLDQLIQNITVVLDGKKASPPAETAVMRINQERLQVLHDKRTNIQAQIESISHERAVRQASLTRLKQLEDEVSRLKQELAAKESELATLAQDIGVDNTQAKEEASMKELEEIDAEVAIVPTSTDIISAIREQQRLTDLAFDVPLRTHLQAFIESEWMSE